MIKAVANFSREFCREPVQVIRGFFRFLYLKAARRVVIRTGRCRFCGNCCRNVLLVHRNVPVNSEKRFAAIVRDHPEYGRLKVNGRNRARELTFSCSWLRDDNTCADYENRLEICSDYPGTGLYFAIDKLADDCGFSLETVKPFGSVFRESLRRRQKGQ